MKNLSLDEVETAVSGTSHLDISHGFKLLIESIEEYASFPKEFATILENRAQIERRRVSSCRQPRFLEP